MSPEEIRYYRIYQKYFNQILTYIRSKLFCIGLPGDLAEDLTQDVFQILWRRWDENQYKTEETLLKWLYNTAYKKLLEEQRSEEAMQYGNIDDHEDEIITSGGIADIEEQLTSDARLKELEAFLGTQLSQLLLLIADGYKYRECAKILKIPLGTVCSVVHRLRQEMKKPGNREKIKRILT